VSEEGSSKFRIRSCVCLKFDIFFMEFSINYLKCYIRYYSSWLLGFLVYSKILLPNTVFTCHSSPGPALICTVNVPDLLPAIYRLCLESFLPGIVLPKIYS
jgi:hypothetical protein